jgi:phytoene dehydrogenase-like protein
MGKTYDAVVVGGGHNGLTCASYLARAGLDVLVAERRHTVGGPCGDYEYFPGYRSSLACSPEGFASKIAANLSLERHGLKFVRSDAELIVPFADGRAFVGWRSHNRLLEEITKFSSRDVKAYEQFFKHLTHFAERLQISLFDQPPTYKTLLSRLETTADEAAFSDWFLGSLRDLLDREFESEQVKALIAGPAVVANRFGPSTPGSALTLLMQALSRATEAPSRGEESAAVSLYDTLGLPIGGMGAITEALRRSIESAGGGVRTGCDVAHINTSESGVHGVTLCTGEEILAKVVVSNLHPHTTLVDLVDAERLESDCLTRIQALRHPGSAFKIGLALEDLPQFNAGTGLGDTHAGCQFRWAPTLDYMDHAAEQLRLGLWSEAPMFSGFTPSVIDPGAAPTGQHLMSVNVSHAPSELANGHWEAEKDRFGKHCINAMSQFIPNLLDIITDYRFWSPADLESEFGLVGANITHLDMAPSAMFARRPMHGMSDYRTPIDGLYLCGSGTFPGGMVTGVPGHNASHQVLADLQAGRGK